ncbi:MAG TPA: P-II family nitrogen regulator [Woeseiaceae bacterium]|nr:P-II family nitrogen regulator [Woeseiaceae bacterium]
MSIVRKGWGNTVLDASVRAGAHGGTVMTGRGTGVNEQQTIFGIPIEPEKEIVLTVTYADQNDAILDAIVEAAKLNEPGHGLAFVVPVQRVVGVPHAAGEPGIG